MTRVTPPISRRLLREQVADVVADRIVTGHYPPGTRLLELELAQELGVSQGSIREAFRDLAAQRLVVTEPHRGTRVRCIDKREVLESYEVRAVLEQYGCELATARAENFDELARLAERARHANDADDRRTHTDADRDFHNWIMKASANKTLINQWEGVWSTSQFRLQTAMALTVGRNLSLDKLVDEHFEIVDAMQAREGRTAGQLLRAHLLHVASLVDASVPEGIISLPAPE